MTSALVDAVEQLTDTAAKGSTVFLNGVAAMLAIAAFVFKVDVFGIARVGALESVEFVAVLALSLLLFMFSAWLRYLEYRASLEIMRHRIWKSQRLIEEAHKDDIPEVVIR